MPYTPPSVQSPVASRDESPALSRSSSYIKSQQQGKPSPSHGSHIELPHSASSRAYLNKHRRSPSILKSPTFDTDLSSPDAAPQDVRSSGSDDEQSKPRASGRSCQSSATCPVVTRQISPPTSSLTSSDEETTEERGRFRDQSDLLELQKAIRAIQQRRTGSPDEQASKEIEQTKMRINLPPRTDPSADVNVSQSYLSPTLPLSAGARKISHSRSSTDSSAFIDFPRNKFDPPARSTSFSDGEDIEEDELGVKPALIRKKSGELVKPVLRGPGLKRRPSSMPGTPTYNKNVHFQDNELEHIRHFSHSEKPLAVSAGSSPVDSPFEDESEFPFGYDTPSSRSPPYDWEIRLANFPPSTMERKAKPVWTEKVFLSADKKLLMGCVIVRNLSFHKLVIARFTVDFWKTTSEVVAEYDNNVRQQLPDEGWDRFTFSIKLEDQANLESKVMLFCVRYNVNGQEYWDNNNSMNYQVEFSKKPKPQNGKRVIQPKSSEGPRKGLPRSNPSSRPNAGPRPMPSFDDFANVRAPFETFTFPTPPSAMVGESPIRFKNKPSAKDIIADAPRPKSSNSQQAFGNRYDFGASLSAAKQTANVTPGDRTELPVRDSLSSATGRQQSSQNKDGGSSQMVKVQPSPGAGSTVKSSEASQPDMPDAPKPAALTTGAAEKPSLQSSSYRELLEKYCYFGTGKPASQSTPQTTRAAPAQVDGTSEGSPRPDVAPEEESDPGNPSSPRNRSPVVEEKKPLSQFSSPRPSRSASPATGSAMGSRTASPVSFGYPYQTMENGLLNNHAPTAIRL